MRYDLYEPDGTEIGFITDEPEFRWELRENTPFREQIERVIKRSAEYEMVVAGGEEPAEDAVTPPEEDVPIDDYGRVVRVASELPNEAPVQVSQSDEQTKGHIAEELVQAVEKVRKERVYVDDESEVPEGVEPQEGEQGGIYYDTEQLGDEEDASEPWATASFDDLGGIVSEHISEDDLSQLVEELPEDATPESAVDQLTQMMMESDEYTEDDVYELYRDLGDAFGSTDPAEAPDPEDVGIELPGDLDIETAVDAVADVLGAKAANALFGDMRAPDSGEAPNPDSYVAQAAQNVPRQARSEIQEAINNAVSGEGEGEEGESEEGEGEEDGTDLPDVPPEADEDPEGGEWDYYRSIDDNFDRINVGDVVAFRSPWEDPSTIIGEVVDWSEDEITIETEDGETYSEEYGGDYGVYTFEEDEPEDDRSLEERWEDSNIPQSGEEAAEMYLENLEEREGEIDEETRENWQNIMEAGVEGLDEDHAETVLEGYEANQNNEEWQELVEATGIEEDVVAINPDAVAEEMGHAAVGSQGGGKYIAGTAFVRAQDDGILLGEDRRPEPGQPTAGRDAAGIIRHELSHKIWEETDDDFKEWFEQQVPDDETLKEELTEYAGIRDTEEAFNELITVTTNPEFNPQKYPDWVSELSQETREVLGVQEQKAQKIAQKALERKFARMDNERRESVVKVEELQTPDVDIEKNKTFRKAGENYILVDDLLMEAFEKQIWQDDLTKAPNMWERDDNVPQFVRSHVKEAIEKTDVLYTQFDNIPHTAALKVHEIIKDQLTDPQGWSIETVTKELADEFEGLAKDQAEDIARTEIAAVLNKAREIAYDAAKAAAAANRARNITGLPDTEGPEEVDVDDEEREIMYYWAGPEDHRTTNICSETKDEIDSRGGYVTKDELKEILRAKAEKYEEEDGGLPNRVEGFVPHFNCRHTFIREDYQRVT